MVFSTFSDFFFLCFVVSAHFARLLYSFEVIFINPRPLTIDVVFAKDADFGHESSIDTSQAQKVNQNVLSPTISDVKIFCYLSDTNDDFQAICL